MYRQLLKCCKPAGRVNSAYYSFIRWSFLSNVISSAQNVLGSHSMLSVISEAPSELAVTLNYIGKDLIGQCCSLYYMNRSAKQVDQEIRPSLKKNAHIQNAASLLECATPLVPNYVFLPLAGLANVMKNVSFVGLGSINAIVIQRGGTANIGQLYTKITIVNTIASTVGSLVGLGLAAAVPDHGMRLLTIIPILAAIRSYTLFKSIHGFENEK